MLLRTSVPDLAYLIGDRKILPLLLTAEAETIPSTHCWEEAAKFSYRMYPQCIHACVLLLACLCRTPKNCFYLRGGKIVIGASSVA